MKRELSNDQLHSSNDQSFRELSQTTAKPTTAVASLRKPVRPIRKPQISALTGIRTVLISWVVLFHLQPELFALLPSPLLLRFTETGFVGVDFFFILSGFVIAYNYAERLSPFSFSRYRHFIGLRLARLYPAYLFSLVLVVLMLTFALGTGSTISDPEKYSAATLFQNLLLVQAWSLPNALSWNVVAWAVSCEWLAYLVFPLLLAGTLRFRSASSIVTMICASLLGMSLLCIVLNARWLAPYGAGSYALLRVAVEFPVGCLLYNLYALRWAQRWRWSLITPIIWFIVFVASTTLMAYFSKAGPADGALSGDDNALLLSGQLYVLMLTPLYAFALYAVAQQRGIVSRWLSSEWMEAIAHRSYSLYLTHFICIIVLRRLLPLDSFTNAGWSPRLLVLSAYVLTIATVAALTYRFIERPGYAWMKQRISAH